MSQQMVVPFSSLDEASLDGFYASGNEALITQIRSLVLDKQDKSVIFFWGETGNGKTHLLKGCCDFARNQGRNHAYIAITPEWSEPSFLNELTPDTIVCLDDLHHLKDNPSGQDVIFDLYERFINYRNAMQSDTSPTGALIIAANCPPTEMSLELKDLESRISHGGIFAIQPLSDQAKHAALKLRAQQRGFELEDKAVTFIMNHYDRDTAALFELFEELDRISLSEHRKVTIPFIKRLIEHAA